MRCDPLVPLEQVAGVDLPRHVGEVVAPAVGHDHAAAHLERIEVVRMLMFSKNWPESSPLFDHCGHASSTSKYPSSLLPFLPVLSAIILHTEAFSLGFIKLKKC